MPASSNAPDLTLVDSGQRAETSGPVQARDRRVILAVNDSHEILELFRDILEEENYDVRLYSFAFQDLDEVKAVRPDLIILDFMIGGEDHGWQLLQKLKLDRETLAIPVIVCTAALKLVRELDAHLRAKNVGVIVKPFDIDDLIRQVAATWEPVRLSAEDPTNETK